MCCNPSELSEVSKESLESFVISSSVINKKKIPLYYYKFVFVSILKHLINILLTLKHFFLSTILNISFVVVCCVIVNTDDSSEGRWIGRSMYAVANVRS